MKLPCCIKTCTGSVHIEFILIVVSSLFVGLVVHRARIIFNTARRANIVDFHGIALWAMLNRASPIFTSQDALLLQIFFSLD